MAPIALSPWAIIVGHVVRLDLKPLVVVGPAWGEAIDADALAVEPELVEPERGGIDARAAHRFAGGEGLAKYGAGAAASHRQWPHGPWPSGATSFAATQAVSSNAAVCQLVTFAFETFHVRSDAMTMGDPVAARCDTLRARRPRCRRSYLGWRSRSCRSPERSVRRTWA